MKLVDKKGIFFFFVILAISLVIIYSILQYFNILTFTEKEGFKEASNEETDTEKKNTKSSPTPTSTSKPTDKPDPLSVAINNINSAILTRRSNSKYKNKDNIQTLKDAVSSIQTIIDSDSENQTK
jgi:hypothetical protein